MGPRSGCTHYQEIPGDELIDMAVEDSLEDVFSAMGSALALSALQCCIRPEFKPGRQYEVSLSIHEVEEEEPA